eukprot:1063741-Prorocentrum_minimum.AAC.1
MCNSAVVEGDTCVTVGHLQRPEHLLGGEGRRRKARGGVEEGGKLRHTRVVQIGRRLQRLHAVHQLLGRHERQARQHARELLVLGGECRQRPQHLEHGAVAQGGLERPHPREEALEEERRPPHAVHLRPTKPAE